MTDRWRHQINFPGGHKSGGFWRQNHILEAIDTIDFQGKTVLDVGTLEGRWAFEAESRGGKVTAIDVEEAPLFQEAYKRLKSGLEYLPMSLYDIAELGRTFDIVLCMGVYYHLKDPVLAFERLRGVMEPGALMLVEGQAFESAEAEALFFHRDVFYQDPTNWWIPSTRCLEEWLECSGFEIAQRFPVADASEELHVVMGGRAVVQVVAV